MLRWGGGCPGAGARGKRKDQAPIGARGRVQGLGLRNQVIWQEGDWGAGRNEIEPELAGPLGATGWGDSGQTLVELVYH